MLAPDSKSLISIALTPQRHSAKGLDYTEA